MKLEDFLSLLGCVALLLALATGMSLLSQRLRGEVAPLAASSSPPP